MTTTPGRSPTSDLLCVTAGCKRPVTEGSAYLCAECAARIASVGSCPTSEAVCECGHPRDAHSYWSERRQEYGACSRCPHNECDEYEESTGRLPASEPTRNLTPSESAAVDKAYWASVREVPPSARSDQGGERCATCSDSGTIFESTVVPEDTEIPCPKCSEQQRVIDELRELMLFLCGEGPMVGLHFGDTNPAIKGNYWWRSRFARPRIERALALIERLRARSSVSAGGNTPPIVGEDARDAARYRWLRDQYRLMSPHMDGQHHWTPRMSATLKGPSVDEAIDAAILRENDNG